MNPSWSYSFIQLQKLYVLWILHFQQGMSLKCLAASFHEFSFASNLKNWTPVCWTSHQTRGGCLDYDMTQKWNVIVQTHGSFLHLKFIQKLKTNYQHGVVLTDFLSFIPCSCLFAIDNGAHSKWLLTWALNSPAKKQSIIEDISHYEHLHFDILPTFCRKMLCCEKFKTVCSCCF